MYLCTLILPACGTTHNPYKLDIMSEELIISGETKEEKYASLLPQIESLISHEDDPVAVMANVSAAISDTFGSCGQDSTVSRAISSC